MSDSIRINLHGHSQLSDGELAPDQLAERMAAAGARAAALTDHDTIEGLPAFREALLRRGVGFIAGVELTVVDPEEGEKHILGYGFDPENRRLKDLLGRAAGNRRRGWRRRWPCVPQTQALGTSGHGAAGCTGLLTAATAGSNAQAA